MEQDFERDLEGEQGGLRCLSFDVEDAVTRSQEKLATVKIMQNKTDYGLKLRKLKLVETKTITIINKCLMMAEAAICNVSLK